MPQPRPELIIPDAGSAFRWLPRVVDRFHPNLHHHSLIELHAIERGAGTAILGGRLVAWTAPVAFLLGPDLPHTWISGPHPDGRDLRSWVLQWSPELVDRLPDLPETAPLRRTVRGAKGGIWLDGAAAAEVSATLASFPPAADPRRLAAWITALVPFAQGRRVEAPPPDGSGSETDRISSILAWIDRHLDQPLSLAGAARVAGLHPKSLARILRRTGGTTFLEQVHQRRIARACTLLLDDGRANLAQVALRVGFRSQDRFQRVFRQQLGLPPSAWRCAALAGTWSGPDQTAPPSR